MSTLTLAFTLAFTLASTLALPAAALPSFSPHVVDRADTWTWNAIEDLAQTYGSADGGPIVCSQRRPASVPAARWCRTISILYVVEDGVTTVHHDGDDLFDTIVRAFDPERAPSGDVPAFLMIDELRVGGDGRAKVALAARRLMNEHPALRGRWGAYLVDGKGVSYAALNAAPHRAVDALLDADALIAVEMYPHRETYCASGATAAARDAWLASHYRGGPTSARFPWLVNRRGARDSASRLSVVFAVTDDFVTTPSTSTHGAVYLDRLLYVWATRSQHRWVILVDNGGPGAWKWDAPYVSNTSRDEAFAASFEHYAVEGRTSSRLGPVPCP